jgi:hypothetical protein
MASDHEFITGSDANYFSDSSMKKDRRPLLCDAQTVVTMGDLANKNTGPYSRLNVPVHVAQVPIPTSKYSSVPPTPGKAPTEKVPPCQVGPYSRLNSAVREESIFKKKSDKRPKVHFSPDVGPSVPVSRPVPKFTFSSTPAPRSLPKQAAPMPTTASSATPGSKRRNRGSLGRSENHDDPIRFRHLISPVLGEPPSGNRHSEPRSTYWFRDTMTFKVYLDTNENDDFHVTLLQLRADFTEPLVKQKLDALVKSNLGKTTKARYMYELLRLVNAMDCDTATRDLVSFHIDVVLST